MAKKFRRIATKTLPSTYILYNKFRPSMWKRTHWVNWVLGIVLFFLSYQVIKTTAQALRPDFQAASLGFTGTILGRLGRIPIIILPVAVLLLVHELIHFVTLWYFTGQRPTIVTGYGGFSVQIPSFYIPRNKFLIVDLAPFCTISLLGLFALLVVQQRYLNLAIFLTAINVASSVADITSSFYIFLHSSSIFLETAGNIYFDRSVGPDAVSAWKLHVRSSIEAVIALLEQ